jgi:hypothetical protein
MNWNEWEMPGLPSRWLELIAESLSELSNDEFEEAWRALGKVVRLRSRALRAEAEQIKMRSS